MKMPLGNFFSSLSTGAKLLIGLYALGFPVFLAGHFSHAFNLYDWLALSPLGWKSRAWSLLTYALLPNGIVDWVVSLFWMATLLAVLGRNWRSSELLGFAALTTIVGGVVAVFLNPPCLVAGNGAMTLGFLAAWYRLYGRERLILLGFGELSVRQAAVVVGLVELLILFFGLGWQVTLGLCCGGAAGWLYLFLRGKHALNRHSQVIDSERIARLEL